MCVCENIISLAEKIAEFVPMQIESQEYTISRYILHFLLRNTTILQFFVHQTFFVIL